MLTGTSKDAGSGIDRRVSHDARDVDVCVDSRPSVRMNVRVLRAFPSSVSLWTYSPFKFFSLSGNYGRFLV